MAFFDYTGMIGKGIGTAIGAWFGGPVGATLGGMAGQMEGDKIGSVGKGEADWSTLLTPGPAQQDQGPPAQLGPLAQGSLGESINQGNFQNQQQYRSNLISDPGQWSFGAMPNSGDSFGDFKMSDTSGGNGSSYSSGSPGFSILKDAPSYSDPTSGTPAPSTPTADTGGFNWANFGKALQGVGHVLSGTAAGLQGDTGYNMRLQQQMDEAANRKKLVDQQAQKIKLDQATALPKILEVGKYFRDELQLTDEQKANFAPKFDEYIKETTGLDLGGMGAKLLSGKGTIEAFDETFKALGAVPEKTKLAYMKKIEANPQNRDKIVNDLFNDVAQSHAEAGKEVPSNIAAHLEDKQREQIGQTAVDRIIAAGNRTDAGGQKLDKATITNAQALEVVPNFKYATDKQITQANLAGYTALTAPGVAEALAKSEPARKQSEEHFKASQAQTEANRAQAERHFKESQAQAKKFHEDTLAHQKKVDEAKIETDITSSVTPLTDQQRKSAANLLETVKDTPEFKKATPEQKKAKMDAALKAQGLQFLPGTGPENLTNKLFGLGSINPDTLPVVKIPTMGKGRGIPQEKQQGPSLQDLIKGYGNTPPKTP